MGRTPKPQPVHTEFGSRVRRRRQDLGWTIEQLAQESGLHPSYVAQVERGERNIALENTCKLAKALSVDAALLTDGLDRLV